MPVPPELAEAYAALRAQFPTRGPGLKAANGLALLRGIAQLRGGELLSPEYLGSEAHHRMRCALGHEWQVSAGHLLRGTWCPACVKAQNAQRQYPPDAMARIHRMAQDRGGECLDKHYEGRYAHYRFRCAKGHEWQTSGQTIVTGSWCPHCDGEMKASRYTLKNGLQRLQQKAQEQGGDCLSDTYLGTAANHRFKCQKGHEWGAPAGRVLAGSWCPLCCQEGRRLGIAPMQALAAERGGQCLSEDYMDSTTKLEWLCRKGHTWWAIPANVKRGSWCPECARLDRISNRKNLAARIRGGAAPNHTPELLKAVNLLKLRNM